MKVPLSAFRGFALLCLAFVLALPALRSRNTVAGQSPVVLTAEEFVIRSTQLRVSMKKTEVAKTMGEPNIKTTRKWIYAGRGVIHFSPEGTLTEIIPAKK